MKYKYSIIIIIILVIISSISNSKKLEKERKTSNLMSNNIEFSGIVTDIKISKNHDFGIITIRIDKTNSKKFNPIIDENHLFPYIIKDSTAEIYTVVSKNLKKGDSVRLSSNDKNAIFSSGNSQLYIDEIYITSVKRDIEFVKENSSILNH